MTPERPLLSFVLLSYNQERFIAEAVEGALSQTYSPLEILLSDDCSSDRTFEIMREKSCSYRGEHQVYARQNDKNLGLGAHINRLMELARGELIVIAAGDDVSLAQRTERLWQEYLASGKTAYSLFSNEYLIDTAGNKVGLTMAQPPATSLLSLERFTRRLSSVTGSSQAWHRKTFDLFGPLGAGVVNEDAVIPFRALLLGSIRYVNEPLVLRRYTGENLSLGSLHWWDKNADVSGFQAGQARLASNCAALYATRLHDLSRMTQIAPDRRPELEQIGAVTRRKLERVRNEVAFWSSGNRGKLEALLGFFARKRHYGAAARLTASWLFPAVYMRAHHLTSYRVRGKLSEAKG